MSGQTTGRPPGSGDDPDPEEIELPLAQSLPSVVYRAQLHESSTDLAAFAPLESLLDPSEGTSPRLMLGGETVTDIGTASPVALGEALQLVHYARRGDTILISGITPHGRRLTFEQREDRQGWHVVAAGRRRRPTRRELGLVVATITREMEAGLIPERQAEVRSAYHLAAASDQPGMPVAGLDAYRDLLLDEAESFLDGQIERLAVVSIEYQAFKRFAVRHGHRIAAAFVQALGERLKALYGEEPGMTVFHKTGKSFRMVVIDRQADEIRDALDRLISEESRTWLTQRVWGDQRRTHPDEVHCSIGVATAYPSERASDYASLAQRISNDAFRASQLGRFQGHTSLVFAKSDYRSSVYFWNAGSEDELDRLGAQMDDGPAEVAAEMSDYLHELVPADLEGMAVAGDLDALIFSAIARDGFWQGTTAMRIAGDRLTQRFILGERTDENDFVGGFDLGDEFYGIAMELDEDAEEDPEPVLYFARGDVNSAGATRVRAGLGLMQQAVGWRREDGGGIVGRFIAALAPGKDGEPLLSRLREAAQIEYQASRANPELAVNDAVDIGGFLFAEGGEPASGEHLVEGSKLSLVLPGRKPHAVEVVERRSGWTARLAIDGEEYPAVFTDTSTGLQLKLRIRAAVPSAAVCLLIVRRLELLDLLKEIREENNRFDDAPLDVVGFLRHITDILLVDHVKLPGKLELALGAEYQAERFVRAYTLEEVRERHPGLFYEAVHHDLLEAHPAEIDRQLIELIGHTMLSSPRPLMKPIPVP